MFCYFCGKENVETNNFCKYCGKPLHPQNKSKKIEILNDVDSSGKSNESKPKLVPNRHWIPVFVLSVILIISAGVGLLLYYKSVKEKINNSSEKSPVTTQEDVVADTIEENETNTIQDTETKEIKAKKKELKEEMDADSESSTTIDPNQDISLLQTIDDLPDEEQSESFSGEMSDVTDNIQQKAPFFGIWCSASKNPEDALKIATELTALGSLKL